MPSTATQSRPVFRVRERHPVLRGLSALVLCAIFVLSFILTITPGVGDRARSRAVEPDDLQRRT